MRKILFPFELDNLIYREAYIFAIKFARKTNAELIALNVFKVEVDNDITEEKYGKLKKDKWFKAYIEISRLHKYYLEHHTNPEADLEIKINYRFVHGVLIEEIKDIANEDGVGLVMLPISDNKEFNKRQEKIIKDNIFERNRTSLLIIPFGYAYKTVKNIVFATDLKNLNNSKLYINEVIEYARMLNANIHFIHITKKVKAEVWDNSSTYRMVMLAIENNKKHTFRSLHGKKVIESVNQYVEQSKADLLVVVKHQHYFLESIFHVSISNDITLKSKVPVMIMREKTN